MMSQTKTLLLATLLSVVSLASHAQPRLSIGVVPYGGSGGNITVPVTLSNDGDVRALQFDLQYPQGAVEVGALLPGVTLSAENELYRADVNGAPINWVQRRVLVTPTTSNALLTSGALLDVSMQALNPPAVNGTTIKVVNVVMSDGLANVVASNTCAIGGFIYNPSDTTTDTDTDGLANVVEAQNHLTNPGVSDSDCDGMPDGFEVAGGLNPLLNDASGDRDGDGVTNLAEFNLGTNPASADSDGDGMPDGYEISTAGLDPLNPADGAADFDGDGLTNAQEYVFGTNIALIDTDGDGISDYDEWLAAQNPPTTTTATLAAGYSRALSLRDNGTVWQWGDGASTPAQISGLANVKSVASGVGYSLVLTNDGSVWGWGANTNGELGNGTFLSNSGAPIDGAWSSASSIAAGWYSTYAVKTDGTVWASGSNMYGQLGDGTMTNRATPVQVAGLSSVMAVAASQNQVLALKQDGAVWAWGTGLSGELGDGVLGYSVHLTPTQVSGLTNVIAISAGYLHSVALKADGTVWEWGYNGINTYASPTQVTGLTGVTAIDAGRGMHTLALKSDGTVWAWGVNGFGRLGDGTTTNRASPVMVSGLSGVQAIAAGFEFSTAMKSDGTVWAWGRNNVGQLGDGTTTDRLTSVQVIGLSGGSGPPSTIVVSATPSTVASGEVITVSWSTPAGSNTGSDWVGLYPVGGDQYSYKAWAYTGGAQTGTMTFTAPSSPGTYEVRYLIGYQLLATSAAVTVTAPATTGNYSVSATPDSVAPGETITVNWTTPTGSSTGGDWVGMYAAGTDNYSYIAWAYTGGAQTGTITFTAPSTSGSYEVRYLNGYQTIATSNSVTVQTVVSVPAPTVTFSASAQSITLGYNSVLQWSSANATSCSATDGWSGSKGTTGTEAVSPMVTTTYTLTCAGDGGSVSQSISVSVDAHSLTAAPSVVSPGGAVTVTWTAPAGTTSASDWVGMFAVGVGDGAYVAWTYTENTQSGSYVFTVPTTPGNYEFRFFDRYNARKATSNTITVN